MEKWERDTLLTKRINSDVKRKIKKKINKLWFPKVKESFFYYSENLLPKKVCYTGKNKTQIYCDRYNVFSDVSKLLKATSFLRGDINNLILKFCIENNCLADYVDLEKGIDLYYVYFNMMDKTYHIKKVCYEEIPNSPLITDKDKGEFLIEYLNILKKGLCNKNNFEEEYKIIEF